MVKGIALKKLKIELTTLSPLHIGGKEDILSGIHGPMTQSGDKVIIPGPSVKGAFRASLERVLISNYPNDNNMKPCIPATFKNLSEDEKALIKNNYRGPACIYKKVRPEDKQNYICPVCYLLGAQSLGGFIFVPFLTTDCRTQELYSIRLDRALGIGASKSNREYEFIPEGIVFSGIMEVTMKDDFRNWSLAKPRPLALNREADKWLKEGEWDTINVLDKLIKSALKSINQIGGFKSKGFGKVEVKVVDLDDDKST